MIKICFMDKYLYYLYFCSLQHSKTNVMKVLNDRSLLDVIDWHEERA